MLLLSNLHEFYSIPEIVPPVPADNPLQGKPSDHSVPVARPHSSTGVNRANEYKIKISRPMPDSGIRKFGMWIIDEQWDCIVPGSKPADQAVALQQMLEIKMDEIFPTKTVKLSNKDKCWANAEIKLLNRQKQRIYCKEGKSTKYNEILEKYEIKCKEAAAKYLEKNVRSLKESDPGKAYSTLKRMGCQPGDELDDGTFSLIEHLEANLTNKQSVEKIAEHFSQISQEYPVLKLLQNTQNKLGSKLE